MGEALAVIPVWTQPLLAYLINGDLPEEKNEARRIVRRSKAYTIIHGELYKRSVTGIFQRCVSREEGHRLLKEIHAGACSHHAAPRTLVGKAFRHGFFWPHTTRDAEETVCKCEGCQRFMQKLHMPATALKTIPLTWPFAV